MENCAVEREIFCTCVFYSSIYKNSAPYLISRKQFSTWAERGCTVLFLSPTRVPSWALPFFISPCAPNSRDYIQISWRGAYLNLVLSLTRLPQLFCMVWLCEFTSRANALMDDGRIPQLELAGADKCIYFHHKTRRLLICKTTEHYIKQDRLYVLNISLGRPNAVVYITCAVA